MDLLEIYDSKVSMLSSELAEMKAKYDALLYQYKACHGDKLDMENFIRDEIGYHFFIHELTKDKVCSHLYPETCLKAIRQSLLRFNALRST